MMEKMTVKVSEGGLFDSYVLLSPEDLLDTAKMEYLRGRYPDAEFPSVKECSSKHYVVEGKDSIRCACGSRIGWTTELNEEELWYGSSERWVCVDSGEDVFSPAFRSEDVE
jgi:hypothetical protein